MVTNNIPSKHFLLLASGSVAVHKLPNVVKELRESTKNSAVCIVVTASALRFLRPYLVAGPNAPISTTGTGPDAIPRLNTPRASTFTRTKLFKDVHTIASICNHDPESLLYLPLTALYVSGKYPVTPWSYKIRENEHSQSPELDIDGSSIDCDLGNPQMTPVLIDDDEWRGYRKVGEDPVVHIKLRDWATCIALCPLSANTLAKVAVGICDNLVTSILRCWNTSMQHDNLQLGENDFNTLANLEIKDEQPQQEEETDVLQLRLLKAVASGVILVPAMNPAMYTHPHTRSQLAKLTTEEFSYYAMQPLTKTLACGDVGIGGLPDPTNIAKVIHIFSARLAHIAAE